MTRATRLTVEGAKSAINWGLSANQRADIVERLIEDEAEAYQTQAYVRTLVEAEGPHMSDDLWL